MRFDLSNLLGKVFDRLNPVCLLCAAPAGNGSLCTGCESDLPGAPFPGCPVCALPSLNGATCGACLKNAPAYDRAIAAFSYAHPVDAMIQALKYGGRFEFTPVLARALVARIGQESRPDRVIAVPLDNQRLKERGFNQALELAREAAKRLKLSVDANACRRIRPTAPQTGLPYSERAKNVRRAFACERDLSGEHVAIVDDVMTTGATLNEIARVLKRAGAAQVSAWTVARTLPR